MSVHKNLQDIRNVLIIDNYDSFTYNLYQLCGEITSNITVIRNDQLTAYEIIKLNPTHIILSPGPGHPKDAGICEELIRVLDKKTPLLGVCLGHQAICEVFGAKITGAKEIVHGKASVVTINTDSALFASMPNSIQVARYHSLVANNCDLPGVIKVISDGDDEIMAVNINNTNFYGVQFHPESILTPLGPKIIENFLGIPNF